MKKNEVDECLELNRQYSVSSLRQGLRATDKIVYSENGNRAINGKVFLKKIEKLLPKLGVTRIADISYLSAANYPVFQSCRPNVWDHSRLGQNTGSQGKGPSVTQAKISCIMETIEGYCHELRNPTLLRASYQFLKDHHVVANPDHFMQTDHKILKDESIMWTPAYSVELDSEVLVPAECVYFPFMPKVFQTTSSFICSTNGLASGATYLEAAIHALYELIERHYTYFYETGKIHIEAMHEEELLNSGVQELISSSMQEFELQLYSYEIPGIKNLPVVYCILNSDSVLYQGWGCSSTVEISIDRAISEAMQGVATNISGAREDMDIFPLSQQGTAKTGRHEGAPFEKTPQPERRTLRVHDYQKRVYDKKFKSLKDEYQFLVKWLRSNGFKEIYFANLTRVGIDIPVVKAIIPNMEVLSDMKSPSKVSHQQLIEFQYLNIHFENKEKRA